jgi:hypothetical protein
MNPFLVIIGDSANALEKITNGPGRTKKVISSILEKLRTMVRRDIIQECLRTAVRHVNISDSVNALIKVTNNLEETKSHFLHLERLRTMVRRDIIIRRI